MNEKIEKQMSCIIQGDEIVCRMTIETFMRVASTEKIPSANLESVFFMPHSPQCRRSK